MNNGKSVKKITILIPSYNEAQGIGKVIDEVPIGKLSSLGYSVEIIVIDNNSIDNTGKIAEKHGAKVISEKKQGKGNAVIAGFRQVSHDTDFVVMIDGDNTYKAHEIIRLIEPLESNFCDVVIGSRLGGKIQIGSMSKFNRIGNWFFTFIVRVFYNGNVTDVCTGYFAWKKIVVDDLTECISSNGFTLEMEMIAKMAKLKYAITSVPITYDMRKGESSLIPIKEGINILATWAELLFWKPKTAKYNSLGDNPHTRKKPWTNKQI